MLYVYEQIEMITLLAADPPLIQWTSTCSLFFVVEGRGELRLNGDHGLMHSGVMYGVNAGSHLEIRSLPHTDLFLYALSFRSIARIEHQGQRSYVEQNASLAEAGYREGEITSFPYLHCQSLMNELRALEERTDERAGLERQQKMYELLLLLPDAHQQEPLPAIQTTVVGGHRQHLAKVIDYLHAHYAESVSRDEMAAFSGFSPRFFSQLFKQEIGLGFVEYLTDIRIRRAKELLLLSQMNLEEIARQVGYANGQYLSRKFKQVTGVPPSAYVRSIQRVIVYDWVGNALALGLKPVGATYFSDLQQLTLLHDELEGVQEVGGEEVAKVAGLSPELIIVPKWLQSDVIASLQRIAPTLVVPYGNPFERFIQLAERLNRQHEADKFTAAYLKRAAAYREELFEIVRPEETVGLYEVADGSIWVLNEWHGRGGYNLYKGLGFSAPPAIRREVLGRGFPLRIEWESLWQYAANHMIFSYNDEEEDRTRAVRMFAHPVWEKIRAEHRVHVYTIDRRTYHPMDVLSLYKQLELQRLMFLSRS